MCIFKKRELKGQWAQTSNQRNADWERNEMSFYTHQNTMMGPKIIEFSWPRQVFVKYLWCVDPWDFQAQLGENGLFPPFWRATSVIKSVYVQVYILFPNVSEKDILTQGHHRHGNDHGSLVMVTETWKHCRCPSLEERKMRCGGTHSRVYRGLRRMGQPHFCLYIDCTNNNTDGS